MTERFLLCRRCRVLHPLDLGAPETSAEARGTLAVDLEGFRAAHAAHELEPATRQRTPTVVDRPIWDPLATVWFEIDAGENRLLVRSWRASIDEPRCHDLADGVIHAAPADVDIDETYLRLALDHHFHPHALRPVKVDRFVALVRALAARLDLEQLQTTFDDAASPDAGIAPFPEHLRPTLLLQCADIFDAWELPRVAAFVDAHRLEDGALALRLRHQSLVIAV